MLARDVMTTAIVSVTPETNVEILARLLVANRISAVPVVGGDGELVGIVSEGDLMRRPESKTVRPAAWWLWLLLLPEERARKYIKSHGRRAQDVMTRQVVTVKEDATLEAIADILEQHRIKRVPVVQEDKLVGIVSRADLLHGLVARQSAPRPTNSDEAIKNKIQEELAEAGVMASRVNVVVSGGVVHLWGTVITPAERDAVRVAVEGVVGVKSIYDKLAALPPDERAFWWAV
jgi:CBS domain-containing protein